MTALNGLSGAVQTISTGTTGTDFNVASSGTNHQFNIPTSSATNRGALSTADWTTFNGKQDTLVSGTNIKTVNGNSLVGSGDIATNPYTLANINGNNLTGNTNQISASYRIAGGTLATDNTLYIKALLTKTVGSSTSTPRIYINTSNTLTGATLLSTALPMTGTAYYQRVERHYYFNGTALNGLASNSGASSDATSNAITLTLFNAAIDYYIIFAIQNSSTTPDNLGWRRVIIQRYV